jgi:ketosteroid isomerase-like protein
MKNSKSKYGAPLFLLTMISAIVPAMAQSTNSGAVATPVASPVTTVTASVPAKAETGFAQGGCPIHMVDPHMACEESKKVVQILRLLVDAYNKGDLDTYSKYLADGCTTFDENSKKLITGKEAVLADLKAKFAANGIKPGAAPTMSKFIIDQPYARVDGNTAVVSFKAVKEFTGKNAHKEEAHITDIFVKEGDTWKKLHYRGRWKKVS